MLKKALYWRQYRYFGQRPNKVPFPKCIHSQCVHSENRILPKKAPSQSLYFHCIVEIKQPHI